MAASVTVNIYGFVPSMHPKIALHTANMGRRERNSMSDD